MFAFLAFGKYFDDSPYDHDNTIVFLHLLVVV
jgi:hypothetical protein